MKKEYDLSKMGQGKNPYAKCIGKYKGPFRAAG